MADESVYGITEKICPMCGKKFIPAPLHVYKRNYGRKGRTKWLCSYHCMLAYDKEHPPKRKKPERKNNSRKGDTNG